MKKILFLFLVPLFIACDKGDLPSEVQEMGNQIECPVAETSQIIDEDLQMYVQYNDSLMKAAEQLKKLQDDPSVDSRSLKETINKITIVLADIRGAYEGFERGKGIGGKILGALLGAIIGSALAALQLYTPLPFAPCQASDYEVAQYRIAEYRLNSYQDEQEYWKNKTGLTLDAKYDEYHQIGKAHNVTLDMQSFTSGLNIESAFTPEEWTMMNDESFKASILAPAAYYNGTSTQSPYTIVVRTKADQIMSLFMTALDNDTYRLSNVNTVIKDYISMVEKTSGISSTDKEQLISSMIVASYSKQLWTEYGVPDV